MSMSSANGLVSPEDDPAVIDAVIDQKGVRWIKFGTSTFACWFSVADLQTDEKSVFAKLADAGICYLTTKRRNKFKQIVEDRRDYRKGLVAPHSGWIGRHFVFGDGTVVSPRNDPSELILAFRPNRKFIPVGNLNAWHEAISPALDQPVCLFAIAYAFVAPLLRFAPPNLLNPQLEIVGPPECGKTTLAVAAASVWAGDPNNEAGGGQTWDATALSLDHAKAAHAGGILFLDEGNLAGADKADQKEVIRRGIFSMSSKGMRRRFTDVDEPPFVHVAVLSTSNVPLRDIVEVPGTTRDALMSRMPTIQIDARHKYGVFKSLPAEFATSRAAAEHIRKGANHNYGVASRLFVEQLVRAAEDEDELRAQVEKFMRIFLRSSDTVEGVGLNRVLNTFALTFAAGALAKRWGVLPRSCGKLIPPFSEVLHSIYGARSAERKPPAIERIVNYVEANALKKRNSSRPSNRLSDEQFKKARGFVKADGSEVLIPTGTFTSAFSDHAAMLKELRAQGYLKGEAGEKPKMSIKTPRKICATGRVYRIALPSRSNR